MAPSATPAQEKVSSNSVISIFFCLLLCRQNPSRACICIFFSYTICIAVLQHGYQWRHQRLRPRRRCRCAALEG